MKNNHLPDSPFFRFMDVVGDVFLLNLAGSSAVCR